jgi:hypothetical protein
VFKKFGKTLRDPRTKKELYLPPNFKAIGKFQISTQTPEQVPVPWENKLTKSHIGFPCAVCGAIPTEMHHVKKIRDLKSKLKRGKISSLVAQMAAIHRKQFALCKLHHIKAHSREGFTPGLFFLFSFLD